MNNFRKKVAIILLASGFGKRFGKNKLLEEFHGRPLFTYAAELAVNSPADIKVIVTQYNEVETLVKTQYPSLLTVRNSWPEEGISRSIRLGLETVLWNEEGEKYEGCCFMVCDQPFFKKESMEHLFQKFYEFPDCISVCSSGAREGNPVIFPKCLFKELLLLKGDRGGKKIIKKYPKLVRRVEVSEEELYDMDNQIDKINMEKT